MNAEATRTGSNAGCKVWGNLLFGGAGIVVGMLALVVAVGDLAAQWVRVSDAVVKEARVVEARVDETEMKRPGRGRTRETCFVPELEFEFTYRGKQYTGSGPCIRG
jgi:hypothetical protein